MKDSISKAINEARERHGITIRELAAKIGLHHPQIVRVTNGGNYNIESLLKILDGLNLEIVIKKKEE